MDRKTLPVFICNCCDECLTIPMKSAGIESKISDDVLSNAVLSRKVIVRLVDAIRNDSRLRIAVELMIRNIADQPFFSPVETLSFSQEQFITQSYELIDSHINQLFARQSKYYCPIIIILSDGSTRMNSVANSPERQKCNDELYNNVNELINRRANNISDYKTSFIVVPITIKVGRLDENHPIFPKGVCPTSEIVIKDENDLDSIDFTDYLPIVDTWHLLIRLRDRQSEERHKNHNGKEISEVIKKDMDELLKMLSEIE